MMLVIFLFVSTVSSECTAGEQTVCEGGNFDIQCGPDKLIKIKSAFYGRKNIDACPSSVAILSIPDCGCTATEALQRVETRCNRKKSCNIPASNGLLGDPCRGVYKYMTVSWTCEEAGN